MLEKRIKFAQSHIRLVDDQNTCHGVNHSVLIALLMKRWIRLKGDAGVVTYGVEAAEQKDIWDLSQQLRHSCFILFTSLSLPAEFAGMIRQIFDALVFSNPLVVG